jgi:hypothetical protein
VPAVRIVNEIRERRERGSTFTGAEGRDQKDSIVLVKKCRRSLLIRTQDAIGKRRIHLRATFDFV